MSSTTTSYQTASQAFRAQFYSAKRRRIEFALTFEQWWDWWQSFDSQHDCIRWERRGMGKDGLVMARFGDVGPYALDNIYCATHSQNFKDVDHTLRSNVLKVWHEENGSWLTGKRGDQHPKSRALSTPEGRFGSASLAADHYGISRTAAAARAHKQLYGWQWEQP